MDRLIFFTSTLWYNADFVVCDLCFHARHDVWQSVVLQIQIFYYRQKVWPIYSGQESPTSHCVVFGCRFWPAKSIILNNICILQITNI